MKKKGEPSALSRVDKKTLELLSYFIDNPLTISWALVVYGATFRAIFYYILGAEWEKIVHDLSIVIFFSLMVYYNSNPPDGIIYHFFEEENGIDKYLAITRNMFWDLRVAYSVLIGSAILYHSSKMEVELIQTLINKEFSASLFFLLAPLITWAFMVIKKDVEIGKMRESWLNEVRDDISALVGKAFILKTKKGGSGNIEKADEVYNALVERDMISEAEAVISPIREEAREIDKILEEILESVWRLETKLVALNKKKWEILRKRVIETRTSCLNLIEVIRLINDGRVKGGRIKPKKELITRIDSSLIKSMHDLQYSASFFLRTEWEEIKKYDKECKKTILMIMILVGFFVISYGNLIFTSASHELP
ncbi:hypothetical protein PRZ61_06705 [Halomonas pacifica]|uniref:hypothetical protein n=1 Tax=Bisbaumannia pacifica TaxID=77098 RepID=UPI002359BD0E|nr:hypothetical protein [Halomonas pacifica]MDC8803130.1 hypothetical protein [Halomonas pacifica]